MMPNKEQIELFDKVLDYFIECRNRGFQPNTTAITNNFNTDKETAQFAFNEVCRIGHELGILTAQKLGYSNYAIVGMEKTKLSNFKNSGGFKKYFDEQKDEKTTVQSIHVANNYGQINQGGNQSRFTNLDQNFSNNIPNQKHVNSNQNSFWQKTLKSIKSSTKELIIGLLVAAIVAYLSYKFGWT